MLALTKFQCMGIQATTIVSRCFPLHNLTPHEAPVQEENLFALHKQFSLEMNERRSICQPCTRSSYMTLARPGGWGHGCSKKLLQMTQSQNNCVLQHKLLLWLLFVFSHHVLFGRLLGLIIFGVGGHTGPKSMKKEGEGGRGELPNLKERDSL